MSGYNATPEELQHGAKVVQSVNEAITNDIKALEGHIDQAFSSWTGAAADAFRTLSEHLTQHANNLNQHINELGEKIQQAGGSYHETDYNQQAELKALMDL